MDQADRRTQPWPPARVHARHVRTRRASRRTGGLPHGHGCTCVTQADSPVFVGQLSVGRIPFCVRAVGPARGRPRRFLRSLQCGSPFDGPGACGLARAHLRLRLRCPASPAGVFALYTADTFTQVFETGLARIDPISGPTGGGATFPGTQP